MNTLGKYLFEGHFHLNVWLSVWQKPAVGQNSSEDQDQDEDFYCVKDWTLLPRDKIKIMSRETWSPSSPNLTIFFMAHISKYEKKALMDWVLKKSNQSYESRFAAKKKLI